MPSPFQQAGALPEASEYAPLVMDRYITGLWTQRSPLRDAAVPYLYEKFYSAGRTDSLIDGLNVEFIARLTWVRAYGNSVYNSKSWPRINRFFAFKPVIDGAETVFTMVDTADGVYDGTAPTPATSRQVRVWEKSAGAGKTFFQQVGNTLYFANGIENKKWLLSQLVWKANTGYSTPTGRGVLGDFIVDPNNNLQQAVGSFTVAVTSIAVQNGVLTVTLDPLDESLPENLNFLVGASMTFEDLASATFLNGQTVVIEAVTPNGLNANTFTANVTFANYAGAPDSGTVTSGTGETAAAAPAWNATLLGYTVDGGAQWINRGNYVQNWGIVAPVSAPAVTQAPLPGTYPLWEPNTYYSTCFLILDEANHVQKVTTFGTTGSTEPAWNDSDGTTNDGGVVWKDQGSGVYASGAAVTKGEYIFAAATDANQYFFQALNAGVTGATVPTFPAGLAQVVDDNGIEWRNVGLVQNWSNVTSTSLSGGFAVIPVSGGGSVAIGVGNLPNGSKIGVPTGYDVSRMLAFTTPGPGVGSQQLTGVATSTAPAGIVNSTWQVRGGGGQYAVSSNFACATWTDGASVTLTSASGYTYLNFTTAQGASLCIVLGQAALANGATLPVPTGFAAAQFIGIAGMANVAVTGNALQSIWCQLNPTTLTLTSHYRDNSLNQWPGSANVFGIFYKPDQGIEPVTITGGTAITVPTIETNAVAFFSAIINSGTDFSMPAGYGGPQTTCSFNSQQDNSAGDNDSHGAGDCRCYGTHYVGLMQDGEGHQWPEVGNIFGFCTLQITTAVSPNQVINDSNGDLQDIAISGLSGQAAPAWNPQRGQLSVDNDATWENGGVYSAASTNSWTWGYAYRNLIDGSVSTMSPVSKPLTLNAGYYAAEQGQYSTDPQVGSIVLYRTDQGGSLFFYDDEIPNNPSGGAFIYADTHRDADLTIEIQAAIAHQNDPPPAGMTALAYHMGRVWGAVNNALYYSDGPDVAAAGNGNTAWAPANSYVLPESLTRLESATLPNGGLLCVTTSSWWVVMGAGITGSNPFINPTRFYGSCGLLNYDAMDVVGSTYYFMSNKGKLMSFDPGSGSTEAGFPISDQFKYVSTGGVNARLFTPSTAFVAWYEGGGSANEEADQGDDTGLFVADGNVGWFRYTPVAAPESGSVWGPFRKIVGGTSAVQAVEIAPGVQNLLTGPADNGPILYRDVSTNQDNGQDIAAPYVTLGNIVLAQSGEVAEVAHIMLDSMAVGTPPTVSVLFGEIKATTDVPFDDLEATSPDPPDLPASETLYSERFSTLQNGVAPLCRHMQLRVNWTQENYPSELLSHAIYGAKHGERRQQQ